MYYKLLTNTLALVLIAHLRPGGLRHASASVSGPQSYKRMKFEAGVHRVQRVPKTEKQGRIHTSTMTVAVLPQPTEVQLYMIDGRVDATNTNRMFLYVFITDPVTKTLNMMHFLLKLDVRWK